MDKSLVYTVQFDIKPECLHTFKESSLNVLNRMSLEDTFVWRFLKTKTIKIIVRSLIAR